MSFEEKKFQTDLKPSKLKLLTTAIKSLLSVGLLGSALTLSACSQPSNSTQQTEQKLAPASKTAPASISASTTASSIATASAVASTPATTTVSNVSQHFTGNSDIEKRLKEALPEIPFSVDNLSAQAVATNEASFGNKAPATANYANTTSASTPAKDTASNASATDTIQKTTVDKSSEKVNKQQALYTKIQALLNWHQFGVGAVDGKWGKNTVKAMQAFQQARNLPVTSTMNDATWQALSDNSQLNKQPVLVNYTLTDADINQTLVKIPGKSADKAKLDSMGYERITEALAEKFHIDEQYLKALNPKATYQVGETITVFNPGQPNLTAVARVVADKTKQQLYAYDAQESLIAVYPTTVGSSETPSPSGTHEVKNRVLKPNYTHTSKNQKDKDILQPGPNNPVGLVWIGLDKDGYGIHGSPHPEATNRQASQGCIRLTNWDALALYGTIQDAAKVEFK